MTNLECEILQSLLVKYVQEAERHGLIDTIGNSNPEKKESDEIINTVKRAEVFVMAFKPGKKGDKHDRLGD